MCITLPAEWSVSFFFFFTPEDEAFAVSKNHFSWSNLRTVFPLYLNLSSHPENTMIIQGLLFVWVFFVLFFVFLFFKYSNKLCPRTLISQVFTSPWFHFHNWVVPVLVLHKALKVLSVQPYITDDETPLSFFVILHWWALTCTYLSIKVFYAQGFLYAAGEATQFTRFYLYITYQVFCCSGRDFFKCVAGAKLKICTHF